MLLWAIGLLLIFGLPNYYRQSPGKVPSFYKSLFRRKIVLWNFVAVILQNFFLSAPYGRNWSCMSPFHEVPRARVFTCTDAPFSSSPVDVYPHTRMAGRHPLHRLLWFCLGGLPLPGQPILQTTQLVPTCLRLWPWGPSLHPDLVGCFWYRVFPSLGRWRLYRGSPGIPESLALVGRFRHHPGSWIWNHPTANAHSHAHVFHPYCLADPRFHRDDLRQGFRTE